MGIFRAAHGWVEGGGANRPGGGGGKLGPPFLPKICNTSYNDETLQSYTLPKEDPGNI